MRIVKIATILIFIASALFCGAGKKLTAKADTTPPVITADSDYIHVEAGSGEEALLEGLTATDDREGYLTSEILVGNISDFTEKGVCTVEYLVFDEYNNVGRYERTVEFDSYTSPRFTLTRPLMYNTDSDIIISDRLMAEDVLDGDISDKVRYSSPNLDRSECGTYDLTVEVKNQYGDEVKETLPINIVSHRTDPEQIRLSTYLVYAEKGSKIDPEQYIQSVQDTDGNALSRNDIRITSQVNMTEAGCGQYCYELYSSDKVVYTTYLTVIVTEDEG